MILTLHFVFRLQACTCADNV